LMAVVMLSLLPQPQHPHSQREELPPRQASVQNGPQMPQVFDVERWSRQTSVRNGRQILNRPASPSTRRPASSPPRRPVTPWRMRLP
jgi:hypothetical protein